MLHRAPCRRLCKRPVDEGMAVARDIGGEHADLAARDLTGRARILTGHAAGGLALLEKSGFIDHENRVIGSQGLDCIIADNIAQSIRIPPAAAENSLLAPGTGIARRLRSHPSGLAPLSAKQAVQEKPGRNRYALLAEQGPNSSLNFPQR
jgi:hypothetical protein